ALTTGGARQRRASPVATDYEAAGLGGVRESTAFSASTGLACVIPQDGPGDGCGRNPLTLCRVLHGKDDDQDSGSYHFFNEESDGVDFAAG
ncbi:MAG: hypothetical protein NTV94_01630, partial [Planctomycetota bacterium]|nr:hypothetical protein [Planctomycetota bacterium]